MSSKEEEEEWDGYRGEARRLLESHGARAGSRIRLVAIDGLEVTGLVVPRYEHAGDEQVVLKLKSGYNIGVLASRIKEFSVLEANGTSSAQRFGIADSQDKDRKGQGARRTPTSHTTPEKSASQLASERKTLLLISTGGTIASRVDYRTGAVHPALSADDLYAAVPELGSIASIIPEVAFSTYSENLTPVDWQRLSEGILSRSRALKQSGSQLDGIVVMLGTDTLAYVSAALSFSLMGVEFPVVCVGAQRSSDRPSSDAALNLKAASNFAVNSKLGGVFVAMHNSENDDHVAIHSGVRVRKNHTSRRDAFESIDAKLIAIATGSEIKFEQSIEEMRPKSGDPKLSLRTGFEPRVALVKFHPGFDPSILDFYARERGVKGLIIEGSGLGHVSSSAVQKLAELVKEQGVLAFMTSQCIWGHVDLNVYETGRDLLEAGVVPLGNMIAETAFAKLSWSIGNFPAEARRIMTENLVGEFTERIPLKAKDNFGE